MKKGKTKKLVKKYVDEYLARIYKTDEKTEKTPEKAKIDEDKEIKQMIVSCIVSQLMNGETPETGTMDASSFFKDLNLRGGNGQNKF